MCPAGLRGRRRAFAVLKQVTLCNLFFSKQLSWRLLLNTVSKTACLWSPVTTFIKYKETERTQIFTLSIYSHLLGQLFLLADLQCPGADRSFEPLIIFLYSSVQPIMTTSPSLFISSSFTPSVVIKALTFSCTWEYQSYKRDVQEGEVPPSILPQQASPPAEF